MRMPLRYGAVLYCIEDGGFSACASTKLFFVSIRLLCTVLCTLNSGLPSHNFVCGHSRIYRCTFTKEIEPDEMVGSRIKTEGGNVRAGSDQGMLPSTKGY